jgi:predicted protein tyrosine phosphatase
MRILFVCSRNRLRSPTAEAVFAEYEGIETASAGTSPDAEEVVSADLIEWADQIFVMEAIHRKKIQQKFALLLKSKKVTVLGIPDDYEFMQKELVEILKAKVSQHLKLQR